MVRRGRGAAQRAGGRWYTAGMCRSIRPLHNFAPPASDREMRAAALQYVRKISGASKPSQANARVFERAVEEVALATRRLLDALVTTAPPRNRQVEAAKARQRAERRFGPATAQPAPTRR